MYCRRAQSQTLVYLRAHCIVAAARPSRRTGTGELVKAVCALRRPAAVDVETMID